MFVTSTEYASKSTGRKGWSRKRKYTIVGAAVAAVAVPTAAWAAITLFGFGDFESAAGSPTTLIVDSTKVTKTLVPGGKTGTTGIVRNNNDFPITVKRVIVKNDSVSGTGTGCDQNSLELLGTPATYPLSQDSGASGSSAGTAQAIAEEVTIGPGGAAWITVPESVSQKPTATALCGLKGRFAVEAVNATS